MSADTPLTTAEIAMIDAAVDRSRAELGALLSRTPAEIAHALAVRTRQQHTDPVTARWDRLVTRDDDGTTWVLCVAETGQPVALALDAEHAEALAGSLLDTPDGEEVGAPGPVARVRALHASEIHYHRANPYVWSATCDHCDIAFRDTVGTLDGDHFRDQYGELRCRTAPRRTCTHCVTVQGEEVPWPCDTITALDEEHAEALDTEDGEEVTLPAAAPVAPDAVLAVVAEWCRESWETGGIDADDLSWRLQEAGHPLPKDGA